MNETVVQNEQLRRYVETHHIDMIPAGARHGKPWQQAAFWAGANINVFNIVLGGVVVAIGLTFWWALIAIAAGTLAGALFIALHATQGPRLGVPQTIQSRGQFGFYGAAFLFPCVLLLNVGFIAAQLVIQSQSAQGVIGSLSIPDGCGSFEVSWLRCEDEAVAVSGVVDAFVLAAQVEAPVGVEVAAGDEGAELQDGLGAFEPPSCARYVHSVLYDACVPRPR